MSGFYQTSLTKGSFVCKPSKLKNKKNVKISNLPSYCKKDFKLLWSKIDSKIQDIESSSYEKTFHAVAKFVSTCAQFPFEKTDEIPAAVLQMGVNMPDHCNILKCLEKILRLQNNYTIILESRKCYNISNIMQLIENELQNQLAEVKPSPLKQARVVKHSKLKPLVLIIQDMETFNVNVLEELIWNCKIYLEKLPIILIFGMSSTMVTLHNILPQRALCHLGIETFHSYAAAEYLTRIIEEVVMSPLQPFKLGPKVFRLVVDTVLYHDFSVTNLKKLLCFSLMKHFYNNKGTILLCSESEIERKVSGLRDDELQFFKELPSLQLYKENNPDISSNLNSSSSFKLLLIELLKNFYNFQNTVIISLKVLHNLAKDLPGSPLGKQFREIYLLNLEKQICHSKGFKEAEKLLKFQSQSELLMKLKSCQEILKSSDQNVSKNLMKLIEHSIQKLSDLTSEDFEKKVLEKSSLENETFTSRFQLQEKMRSSIKHQRSKFEAIRNEIVDTIFQYFQDIRSPSLLPLNEIFFFDEIQTCKKYLMPSPRVVQYSALFNPQQYFECKCCRISESSGEIPSSLPDISVAYKLHQECGKLINLCDWLEAFRSLKDKENYTKRRGAVTMKTDDSKLNILFFQAVTELQLLGFVKPTKRKTDHVAKLTFGTF